jgi:SAM-dependent methyltransferase
MRTYREFLAKTDSAITRLDPRLSIFVAEYRRHRERAGRRLRILDVGCGRNAVLALHVAEEDEYWGCDYPTEIAASIDHYVSLDLNEARLRESLGENQFDVVFCGEVIEHLFSPDALLEDLRRLLHRDGVLVLSTPNLAYWVNRLLLLAGISPLFLENSAEVKLGRRFRWLGQGNGTQGHVHIFTYTAARELIQRKGFVVERTLPTVVWDWPFDRLISRISRSLAANNVFVLRRDD